MDPWLLLVMLMGLCTNENMVNQNSLGMVLQKGNIENVNKHLHSGFLPHPT